MANKNAEAGFAQAPGSARYTIRSLGASWVVEDTRIPGPEKIVAFRPTEEDARVVAMRLNTLGERPGKQAKDL